MTYKVYRNHVCIGELINLIQAVQFIEHTRDAHESVYNKKDDSLYEIKPLEVKC